MKNLLIKFLGPLLAIAGVLGLTGSSILWNFQGRGLGLPATVLSLLTLAVGVVLLRPLSSATNVETAQTREITAIESASEALGETSATTEDPTSSDAADEQSASVETEASTEVAAQKPSITTAEALAAELALAEAERPEIALVNFAPEALRAGNSIRPNKRSPGKNLAGFKDMASELFKTK